VDTSAQCWCETTHDRRSSRGRRWRGCRVLRDSRIGESSPCAEKSFFSTSGKANALGTPAKDGSLCPIDSNGNRQSFRTRSNPIASTRFFLNDALWSFASARNEGGRDAIFSLNHSIVALSLTATALTNARDSQRLRLSGLCGTMCFSRGLFARQIQRARTFQTHSKRTWISSVRYGDHDSRLILWLAVEQTAIGVRWVSASVRVCPGLPIWQRGNLRTKPAANADRRNSSSTETGNLFTKRLASASGKQKPIRRASNRIS